MEYAIVWEECFELSAHSLTFESNQRIYADEDATREDVRLYKKLRVTQGYEHEMIERSWVNKVTGEKHSIQDHTFTKENSSLSMWVGPSMLV